jgi:hypothetical protein
MEMTKGMDEAIRKAGRRPDKAAADVIFRKKPTPAEDERSRLQAEINELRAAIKEDRLNLKYSEALEKLRKLESELEGGTGND